MHSNLSSIELWMTYLVSWGQWWLVRASQPHGWPNPSHKSTPFGKLGKYDNVELFPSPNHPSQLETVPSLSQNMPLLSYDNFFLFLGHKETFSFLQILSCFSLTAFLRYIRGNYTLPFEILSYFYLCLLFLLFLLLGNFPLFSYWILSWTFLFLPRKVN